MLIQMTREEYEKKYGQLPPSVPPAAQKGPVQMTHAEYMAKYGGQPTPTTTQQTPREESGLDRFSTGVAKSTVGTLNRIGSFVANQTVGRVINAAQGQGFKPTVDNNPITQALNAPSESFAESAGKFAGDVASFAVPGGAVTKATKGLSLVPRIAARAAGSGAIASAQEGKIGGGTAVAAGTEALFPIAGAFARPVTRLVKALASGTSGAPAKAISAIVANPKSAKAVAKAVDTGGGNEVIKKNAEIIINGVSKVKKDARAAYAQGVEQLKAVDINPKIFRQAVGETLDSFGSVVKNGVRKLTNVEFDNPAMLKKASTLVDKVSKTPLDGASLNRLQNELDAAVFKIPGADPQRLAFNAFVRDLSGSIRNALGQSTDKLSEINKAFSTDMQLAEAIEGIFGKVKYKNLNEIRKVSQQLETLFNKKGISPQIVDDFLTKVGVKPDDFRASEAVRQISDKEFQANPVGSNISEWVRGVTSAVVTPEFVRNLAIRTGVAEQALVPILQKLAPTARATVIRLLVEAQGKLNE